jgi:hypothetical protein
MPDIVRGILFFIAIALIGWVILDIQQLPRSNVILLSLGIGVLGTAAFETYLNIKKIAQRK